MGADLQELTTATAEMYSGLHGKRSPIGGRAFSSPNSPGFASPVADQDAEVGPGFGPEPEGLSDALKRS